MTRPRRTVLLLPALLVVLVLAGGCTSVNDGFRAAVATPSPTPDLPPVTATAPLATPGPPAAAPGPTSWQMPDLVGVNLQDAQDRIQALTGNVIFVTRSHDASGAGRQQVLDRNWKVCTQNIKAGQKISKDSQIDFGAVKLTERC